MYVCLCKGITDYQIRDAVEGGASSLRQVRKQLGAMTQCGKCALLTKQIVEETLTNLHSVDVAEPPYYAIA
jgi:bacterioferritin-associated ferredoxin